MPRKKDRNMKNPPKRRKYPKTVPVIKAGDVLRNPHTGSIWTITSISTKRIEGVVKRQGRDHPYPYGYSSNIPTDWSKTFLVWEYEDDEFTRWVKAIREEHK
jgi:hypothetical protein